MTRETAMTLEEALKWLGEFGAGGRGLAWYSHPGDGVWWEVQNSDGGCDGMGATWPEAIFEATRVEVVERDPAAELVEALEAYLSAHDALRDWHEDDEGSYDHFKAQMRGDRTLDDLRAALARWKERRDE